MANDAESAIYNKLTTAPTFKPSGVRLFTPDWTLEPGDVVTVQSDGVNYTVPIYSMNLEWRNATKVDIQSSGNQTREPLPALRRREYRSGRRGYSTAQEVEETQQQYQHYVEETDAYKVEMYKVTGVEYDANGNIRYTQATDAQGNPIWETDEQGNYILDEDGNKIPVYAVDNAGNKIPIYNEQSDGSISAQIVKSAQKIGMVIEESNGVNKIRGGKIILAINQTKNAQSTVEAQIEADLVTIDGGTTTINDVLKIVNNKFQIDGVYTEFIGEQNKTVAIQNGAVSADIFTVQPGGHISFVAGQGDDGDKTLDYASVFKLLGVIGDGRVTGASVTNNVLTLTLKDTLGITSTINFSKATVLHTADYDPESTGTPDFTAGWHSGAFKVVATQTNYDTVQEKNVTTQVASTITSLTNTGHWGNPDDATKSPRENANVYYYETKATIGSSPVLVDTENKTTIDATGRYRAGSADVTLKNFANSGAPKWGSWIDDPDDDNNHTYEISTNGRVNASGVANEYIRYLDPSDAINYGKTQALVSKSSWSSGVATFTPGASGLSQQSVNLSISTTPAITTSAIISVLDGQTSTGKSITLYLDLNNQYVYLKNDSSAISEGVNVIARKVNTAYTNGQLSVYVSSATLTNPNYNASARSATATLNVTLSNGVTGSVSGVNVSKIYQAGLDGDSAVNSATFTVTMTDGGTWTNTDTVTITGSSVSDIYQQGVDDATPSTNTLYAYQSQGSYVNVRNRASSDSAYVVGAITTNTDVTFIRNSSGGTYKYVYISYSNNSGTPGNYWINANFLSTTNGHYSQYNYLGWYGSSGDEPGPDDSIAAVTITGLVHQAQYYNGRFPITISPLYPNSSGGYPQSFNSNVSSNYAAFGQNADGTASMGTYFSTVYSSYYATNNTQSSMGPSDTECQHKMTVRVDLKNGTYYTRLITFKSRYR